MVPNRSVDPSEVKDRVMSGQLLDELREELFFKTGRQWAQVSSGSMGPMIRVNDGVLIEPIGPERVRFGDVIVFRSSDQRIVHRVVGKRRHRGKVLFLEKGDLNPFLGRVSADDVLGRVSTLQRNGRTVDLLSGRGRALQVALAFCSIVPLVARQGLRRILHAPGLPSLCRWPGRLLARGVATLSRTLAGFLGPA